MLIAGLSSPLIMSVLLVRIIPLGGRRMGLRRLLPEGPREIDLAGSCVHETPGRASEEMRAEPGRAQRKCCRGAIDRSARLFPAFLPPYPRVIRILYTSRSESMTMDPPDLISSLSKQTVLTPRNSLTLIFARRSVTYLGLVEIRGKSMAESIGNILNHLQCPLA